MPSPFPTQFQTITPTASDGIHTRLAKLELRMGAADSPVLSFNARIGAVTLSLADVSAVADSRYVLKTGDTMVGQFFITVDASVRAITTPGSIESGFQFAHKTDALVNAATVALEAYHESTSGTPTVDDGVSIDMSMDSATVKRQVGAKLSTSWTVAANATRTSQFRIFLPNSGTLGTVFQITPTQIAFFGVAAVTRPSVPDGSTLAQVIDALQAIGLFNPV